MGVAAQGLPISDQSYQVSGTVVSKGALPDKASKRRVCRATIQQDILPHDKPCVHRT